MIQTHEGLGLWVRRFRNERVKNLRIVFTKENDIHLLRNRVYFSGSQARQGWGKWLPVLTCQAGYLQDTATNHVLLRRRQGALLDLRDAFHVVHGPDDADRHFDVPLGE